MQATQGYFYSLSLMGMEDDLIHLFPLPAWMMVEGIPLQHWSKFTHERRLLAQ